jgi:hypothetical protein
MDMDIDKSTDIDKPMDMDIDNSTDMDKPMDTDDLLSSLSITETPIYFIDFQKFKNKGELPRRPEDRDLLIDLKSIDQKNTFIVFVSHCWIAGHAGSPDWRGRPHPDNLKNEKYEICVDAIEQTWSKLAPSFEKCFLWLDYGCISQDEDPAGELKQLSKIVACCDCLVTPIVDKLHNVWELKDVWRGMLVAYEAEAWNQGEYAYLNRAWCRMEMFYAANIPVGKEKIENGRISKFRGGLKVAMSQNWRPQILYGSREYYGEKSLKVLEPLQESVLEKFSPIEGNITVASDLEKIQRLMEELQPFIRKREIGYKGDRHPTTGKMHGEVRSYIE